VYLLVVAMHKEAREIKQLKRKREELQVLKLSRKRSLLKSKIAPLNKEPNKRDSNF
jgi:hypothetical protein